MSFLDSIAMEDVQFSTSILRTSIPGDNYYKLMIFIEQDRFILDPSIFSPIKGTDYLMATVTPDTYATGVNGLLKSWLYDYYCNGNTNDCILIACMPPADQIALVDAQERLAAAYALCKTLAYHKTHCIVGPLENKLMPELCVTLSNCCAEDRALLSAAPYYPLTGDASMFEYDDIYQALANDDISFSHSDAFMTAHADATRNGSLYSLGLSMTLINGSGTCIGNNIDYWNTNNISRSGEFGEDLRRPVRDKLKAANICFFKSVDDTADSVTAVGVKTLGNHYVQAEWIVNYINYMSKVYVARYITQPNRLRNANTYSDILDILTGQLHRFDSQGSGRLANVVVNAPSFDALPPSKGDEIIVPNAWSGFYTDQVHTVRVSGNLTIAS